ncbi:MAG: protoporphyrinogen oxidase HemJ [Gammaproteobacteria bacterium]|nr:protoporphyrinogen oxidase HemJ [Gammaproteobacteria bacterium]MYB37803.1 protoporphyrinogen oxidase HemJ [Gammaproteobacteria bacterium]
MAWITAFHVIAMVCWMAGLFYLPRLFVYHAMAEDEATKATFRTMERKLYRGITTPSAIATAVFGVVAAWGAWEVVATSVWFWAKMALVLILYAYHGICGRMLRAFAEERNTRSHRFYRWFNEAPILLLVPIVILVVVKP